ncbi:unnamed protein product [Ceutorhynchus assimilis]|uniref:Peroxisomal leader peptide-processing protease n=1 Tax=Ceutorhynchus assimilis TaxID=467358 RepID=A0A9P0DLZ1_9CUCU|nr:unnamed protein product [Ceutorhynchus assimilis]
MNIRSVLIERKDPNSSTIQSTSGILIEEKYVLLTSHIMHNFLQEDKELVENIEPGKLNIYEKRPVKFHVVWKNQGNDVIFKTKTANLYAMFKCENLNEFCKNDFKDWLLADNNINIKKFVSVFIILTITDTVPDQDILKSILHSWLINISSINIKKCDKLFCVSTPFGDRSFLNSYTEGIVSTQLKGSNLFLSDCTSAPGCEGGLAYKPTSWYNNFSFQLVEKRLAEKNCIRLESELSFENCLAQVNCGTNWGTCILLSKEKGIFLTNSHVIQDNHKIRLRWNDKWAVADLIYKTPNDSVFDVAIIKSNAFSQYMTLPKLDPTFCKIGDPVYCAGYPLLSTTTKPEGITVTHGIISAYQDYMLKTTCCVYPGFSGGGVFNLDGNLLGIIVSNTRLNESSVTYPKYNMAIPFGAVAKIVFDYLRTNDPKELNKLKVNNSEAEREWWRLEGKL